MTEAPSYPRENFENYIFSLGFIYTNSRSASLPSRKH